jgi:hypothetical protein
MLGVEVLNSLARHPLLDFVVGYHHGTGSFGNRYTVADMVAVAVGYQDIIGLDIFSRNRSKGVAGDERIYQKFGFVGFN